MSSDSNSPVMSDLEWLAREVDEWNDNADVVFRLDGRAGWVYDIGPLGARGDEYTRAQWAAERQRLQNKPSWEGAPEWAEWLAQGADGVWIWCSIKPSVEIGQWWAGFGGEYASQGQVLGNWQDTLERRPANNTKPVVSQGENNMNDVPLDTVKWDGEGLPPVGAKCEWHGANMDGPDGWVYATGRLVAYTEDREFVVMQTDGCWPTVQRLSNCEFRPIRTPEEVEREELFNLIHQYSSHGDAGAVALADALYDAGYRKQGDKS